MRQLVDVNSDGTISDEELRAHLKGHGYSDEPDGLIARVFSGIDFDSSGEIEKAELRQAFVKYPTLRTAPGLGGAVA